MQSNFPWSWTLTLSRPSSRRRVAVSAAIPTALGRQVREWAIDQELATTATKQWTNERVLIHLNRELYLRTRELEKERVSKNDMKGEFEARDLLVSSCSCA